jgi:hypothetical protein
MCTQLEIRLEPPRCPLQRSPLRRMPLRFEPETTPPHTPLVRANDSLPPLGRV